MEWIFDNFQIVAIVALVLGSLVKQFLEAKAEERRARERNEQEPADEQVFGPDEDWEEARPTTAAPPPLVRPAPPPLYRPPPLQQFEEPPTETHEALKRQLDMQERLRQIREEKSARARQAAAPPAAVKPRAEAASATSTLRAALARPGEARRAIVLREILGPPVGLR